MVTLTLVFVENRFLSLFSVAWRICTFLWVWLSILIKICSASSSGEESGLGCLGKQGVVLKYNKRADAPGPTPLMRHIIPTFRLAS